VCPECLFAVKLRDFNKISENVKDKLSKERQFRVQKVKEAKLDTQGFTKQRKFFHATLSFELASLCYKHFKPAGFLGLLYLQLAWLYRENNNEKEINYLEKAIKKIKFHLENETAKLSLSKSKLKYLLGELYRRTGKFDKSYEVFKSLSISSGIQKDPQVFKLLREQKKIVETKLKSLKSKTSKNKDLLDHML